MAEARDHATITRMTSEIVASYVAHHGVGAGELPQLIAAVGRELAVVGRTPEAPAKPEPAVSIRRSVRHDHLVCLVCSKRFKSLRRHLETAHDLTPAAYRELFDLKPDYPMVAPATAEQRAEIARRTGLGQRAVPEAKPAPKTKRAPSAAKEAEAATTPEAASKLRRRRKAAG